VTLLPWHRCVSLSLLIIFGKISKVIPALLGTLIYLYFIYTEHIQTKMNYRVKLKKKKTENILNHIKSTSNDNSCHISVVPSRITFQADDIVLSGFFC